MFPLLTEHIDRYVTLSSDENQLFYENLVLQELEKDQFLLQAGQICRHEHFVINGGLRLYELDASGHEKVVYFGFEDWWLTDKYSYITEKASQYYLQALEATEVLSIGKATLEALFAEIPALERYFHKVLQENFALWQDHILLMHKSAEEKYEAFYNTYGKIETRLPQHHIASYLGMTRETLNRVRKSFLADQK